MDLSKAKKSLDLFNEKVNELRKSRYFQTIIKESSGLTFTVESSGESTVTMRGPDEDAIKAFVLTFRFFIQDNERCSIHNIAKIYNDRLNISCEWKNEFNKRRDNINQFLDSYSILQINKQRIQFRKILDVFFYCGLAHANEKKKEIFDSWMKLPLIKGILVSEFHLILGNIYSFLLFVENQNNEILKSI